MTGAGVRWVVRGGRVEASRGVGRVAAWEVGAVAGDTDDAVGRMLVKKEALPSGLELEGEDVLC